MELTRAERRRLEKLVGKKPVYYQYTLEQIEEIRQQAIQDKKEEIQKEMNAYVQKKWDSMAAELGGKNEEERMLKVLTLLMSVPARILCEKFHWKPVKDAGDHRSKLLQFSEAVVDEVNRICADENADIRNYQEETWKKYGVKYVTTEDGELGKEDGDEKIDTAG